MGTVVDILSDTSSNHNGFPVVESNPDATQVVWVLLARAYSWGLAMQGLAMVWDPYPCLPPSFPAPSHAQCSVTGRRTAGFDPAFPAHRPAEAQGG